MKSMAVLADDCCSSSLCGLPHSINFRVTDVGLGNFSKEICAIASSWQ